MSLSTTSIMLRLLAIWRLTYPKLVRMGGSACGASAQRREFSHVIYHGRIINISICLDSQRKTITITCSRSTKYRYRIVVSYLTASSAILGTVSPIYIGGEGIDKNFIRFNELEQWQQHCDIHFCSMFKLFIAPTSRNPDNFIGYDAIVNTGVVHKPATCPFCVWDESLRIEVRMHQ